MSVRRDPFETMERMFDQMRRGGFTPQALPGLPEAGFDANVTVEREDDGFVVVADVPGFDREEIDVTFADGTLTIEGTHEHGDGESYRSRSVQESVSIPETVDPETIEASYTNGVLDVWLPVEEADSERHQIDIK